MGEKRAMDVRIDENGFMLLSGWDENLSRISGAGLPNPMAESSYQQYPLGAELWDISTGRKFRYALNGAATPGAGRLLQGAAAPVAGHTGINPTAAEAVGETIVSLESSATNHVANQYAGGLCVVRDIDGSMGAGSGEVYRVKSHPAHVHATDPTCLFTLHDLNGLKTAWTTSTVIDLLRHKLAAVIIHPSPPTAGALAGVAIIDLTASYYFWCQYAGPAPVLADGTLTVDDCVRPSETIDGAVAVFDANEADDADHGPCGRVVMLSADTKIATIDLQLP